jgi:DNA-binding transcriptional ArsR family regulator
MVDQLFGSKTRVKLLKFFFENKGQEFYVRELTRLLGEQINSIRRELINLADAGVVKSRDEENKVFYSVNTSGELFAGLDMMFGNNTQPMKVKPTQEVPKLDAKEIYDRPATEPVSAKSLKKKGVSIEVKDAKLKMIMELLEAVLEVRYVAVMGMFMKELGKDLDMLIVASDSEQDTDESIASCVVEIEKKINRAIKYVVLGYQDYLYRMQINDRFLSSVDGLEKEVLIDRL